MAWLRRDNVLAALRNERARLDPGQVGTIISNLLGNALTHGAENEPVRLYAATDNGKLELWIANGGQPIAPEMTERLFEPFFRGEVRKSQRGLGLGLHIASEIARARGGTLEVRFDVSGNPFHFHHAEPAGRGWRLGSAVRGGFIG